MIQINKEQNNIDFAGKVPVLKGYTTYDKSENKKQKWEDMSVLECQVNGLSIFFFNVKFDFYFTLFTKVNSKEFINICMEEK